MTWLVARNGIDGGELPMRAVLQRVTRASVHVDRQIVGTIGRGLLVLLGVERLDTDRDAEYLAEKTAGLRIFPDTDAKMNLSLNEIGGQVLVVSQFTLCGDVRQGRRPSFINAAEPAVGKRLYEAFVEYLRIRELVVATGRFQADMQVELVNDGPVTILLDSRKQF